MKNKWLRMTSAVAAVVLTMGLAACGESSSANNSVADTPASSADTPDSKTSEQSDTPTSTADIKVGMICLHDENSTYDLNFLNALEAAKQELGLSDDQVIIKKNIPESNECKEAAADLADRGCNIIFADSFGHEPYMLEVAESYPDVQFCHATGTLAHTEGLDNFHNAFASIYEGRYLAGIAAGMKLNEMIDAGEITADKAIMGYVGAYTYAEVISGYTAFYLGAKSVCPSTTMKVQFTGSWYDETAEKEAATTLISQDCVLISQHADSMGAPTACENAGVPNVAYNGSTKDACPNTFLVCSRIDWTPYYTYAINCVMNGEQIDTDWAGDLNAGSVVLSEINGQAAADGTQAAVDEAAAKIKSGELHVFDTANFTVDGKQVDSYLADVDTDDAYTPDTEVVSDGYFHESTFRSAPYFDLRIDGITALNEMY